MSRAQLAQRVGAAEQRLAPPAVVVPDALTILRWAGLEPDPWQTRVAQSRSDRILLNCCRQSGKSTLTAALALEAAFQERGALILVLSPSMRQSAETFRKVLDLYGSCTGTVPLTAESTLRLELVNHSRIVSLPGSESTVRGYSRVRLLIVDEAARCEDSLYYSIRPMLAVSGGRLVALSTPWGRRGWFYGEWTSGEGWERVSIPAEECPRIPESFLEEERRTLPLLWFQSEYMCEFVDTIDQVFNTEDITAAVSAEVLPLFARS